MAILSNSFDGGTDSSAITQANSGGASGDALGYVSGSPTYSSTQAHSGTLSCKIPAVTTTAIGHELASSNFWVRFYFWTQGHYATPLVRLWSAVDAAGSLLGGISTLSNGSLDYLTGAPTVNLAGPVTLNQWVRIEAYWSTTGGGELRLYNSPDSSTVSGSLTTPSNLTSAVATQEARRAAVATDAWIDDFAVSTDGWIGPALSAYPRSPVMSRAAVHHASRW